MPCLRLSSPLRWRTHKGFSILSRRQLSTSAATDPPFTPLFDPDLLRRPDVSFVRSGRLPGDIAPKGWVRIPPDLAVEVVSPNDLVEVLEEKLDDYRKVEVSLIWVIYPELRKVKVLRGDGSVSELREDDELSGEGVIPGFRCPIREILPPRPERA